MHVKMHTLFLVMQSRNFFLSCNPETYIDCNGLCSARKKYNQLFGCLKKKYYFCIEENTINLYLVFTE